MKKFTLVKVQNYNLQNVLQPLKEKCAECFLSQSYITICCICILGLLMMH